MNKESNVDFNSTPLVNEISSNNLFEVIKNGESETIEFKAIVPKSAQSIEACISAFANRRGGSIIFGIAETSGRNPRGVSEKEIEALNFICKEKPYKDICHLYFIQAYGKTIAIIDVQKSNKIVYAGNNAYIRYGDEIYREAEGIRSKSLKRFIAEIKYKNRNPKDVQILKLLDDIETNPEIEVKEGTILYRSRIISDSSKIKPCEPFWGYGLDDSFVPPRNLTKDMRANYRFIPYLYCAGHPYTAVVEVRPRLGTEISLASIEVTQSLRLLDFTLRDGSKRMKVTKERLFAELSMLFSKPVVSDDDVIEYVPTQYIAEYAKRLGYDGIAYNSSLTPELKNEDNSGEQYLGRFNIVIFNYSKCKPIRSNVVKVCRKHIECEQIDDDMKRIENICSTVLSLN